MNAKEAMTAIKIDRWYDSLKKANTTAERRECLNAVKTLLEQYPVLKECYILRDSRLLANRVVRSENYKIFNLDDVPRFNDGIDRETELAYKKMMGLYFIAEVTQNPHTRETLYWVKIGYSSQLGKRVHQYDTHCPTTWRIDFCEHAELESYYHNLLGACCIDRASGNEEWFRVDEATYFEMCEKGFSYFD